MTVCGTSGSYFHKWLFGFFEKRALAILAFNCKSITERSTAHKQLVNCCLRFFLNCFLGDIWLRTTANLVFSGDVFGFIRDFKTRIKFVGRYEQPRALTKSLNLHLLPPKERNEKKVLQNFFSNLLF